MQAIVVKTFRFHQSYIPDPVCECEFCPSDHKPLVLYNCEQEHDFGIEYYPVIAHPSCFLGFLKAEFSDYAWEALTS